MTGRRRKRSVTCKKQSKTKKSDLNPGHTHSMHTHTHTHTLIITTVFYSHKSLLTEEMGQVSENTNMYVYSYLTVHNLHG